MSEQGSQLEAAVFQVVLPQLEAEGFQVFVHPTRNMLPSFLHGFQPDAVAYKGDKKIAIEVKARTLGTAEEQQLQRVFEDHPDWELRVVYAAPLSNDEAIPVASKQDIESHLNELKTSVDAMGPVAALLTAWAIFEAAARRLIPSNLGRPQPPSRLLEALASEGYITPDEADKLRQLGKTRDEVAHGRLNLKPTNQEVDALIGVAQTLIHAET
jgi:uncharacterized protein YutE (UPF0331/DUF86 family)